MRATIATIRATRATSRLAPNVRPLPRLVLRTTVCSKRHAPPAVTVRRFSAIHPTRRWFSPFDTSPARDIGLSPEEAKQMLAALGYDSMEAFVEDTVPDPIRIDAKTVSEHSIPALSESEMVRYTEKVGRENGEKRSFGSARYLGLLKVIFDELSQDLCTITGFATASLHPNSETTVEYPGLGVIRAYHASRGDSYRDICLITAGAHETKLTPEVVAGMKVVLVKNLPNGYLDLGDLREKATKHKDRLGAFKVAYPSTYGVFDPSMKEACQIIHDNGGQVYLDGANLNSQIGLTNPARYGGDVCHLDLHKTFAIPHGGGPDVGPICVASHLVPFLPSHPILPTGRSTPVEATTWAPYGSAPVLLIAWAYIKTLGGQGLADASRLALLKVNYIAHRIGSHYSLKQLSDKGRVAHGLLIDWEELEKKTGLTAADFVERLQDYGFHSPTSTSHAIMIELSKGESMQEIDRFCDAMIWVRKEAEDPIADAQHRKRKFTTNAARWRPPIASSEASWNWRVDKQLRGMIASIQCIRAAAKTCIRSSSTSTMLTMPRPPDMEKLSGLEVGDETESIGESSHDEDSWYDGGSSDDGWPTDVDVD